MRYANPRRVAVLGVAAVAGATLSAGPLPTSGAELAAPAPAAAAGDQRSAGDQRTRLDGTVTLITGDQVRVSSDARGRVSVALEPSDAARSTFETVREPDGDVYVYPEVATAALNKGLLDEELFNVTRLIKQGYGDGRADRLPIIVRYADDPGPAALSTKAKQLAASRLTLDLPRLDYAAVSVDKERAERFWRDAVGVTGRFAAASRLRRGAIDHIWLDRKVEASLDESVPLIGADEARAAGWDGSGVTVAVLDTGIDATHSDFADKIEATSSFVPGETVTDGRGHGTHVASIVAGTGAASDGRYTGVAPGADLVVGKVLDNNGDGLMSWAIAGMEWAVDQGADVVNMSFGSSATDGTDPASVAVNQLSAASDTLFVAAAGNSGRFGHDFTVGTPAAADSALAVANFTKDDERAASSSRGPRLGDHAIKPEIAAPGTRIVAARAAGTSLGRPVDDFYTRLSGTSMASPHVAGVAAMLAQRFPDWDGQQIKDALMSTALPISGYSVYLQGSGRVDAARATSQPVFATGMADFRLLDKDAPVQSETITYTNTGDHDVTLNLTADISTDGSAAEPGMFTLSADTVTVPAGGTAQVDLTLDPSKGATGRYSGQVRATDGAGVVTTTAVGFVKEPPSANLTVRVFDRNGDRPAAATIYVQDVHDATRYFERHGAGNSREVTIRVPLGDYSLQGSLASRDPGGTGLYYASDMFALPNVSVTEDTTVTIDARQAQDLEMDVVGENRPLDGIRLNQGLYRFSEYGGSSYALGSNLNRTNSRHGAIPSDQAEVGELYYSPYLTQREPLLRARTLEPVGSPVDIYPAEDSPRFSGTKRLDLVDVGAGEPADYEGVDVAGDAVLVHSSSRTAKVETAMGHGAEAVIFAAPNPGVFIVSVADGTSVPVMAVPHAEGVRLGDLLQDGSVRISLSGVAESGYGYPLRLNHLDGIPDDLSMRVPRRDLVRVENTFHSDVAERMGIEILHSLAPWDLVTGGEVVNLRQPSRRVDYVVPGAEMRYQHQVWAGDRTFEVDVSNGIDARYRAGQDVETSWHKQPYHPSENPFWPCNVCRSGNQLRFDVEPNGDAELGHWGGNRADITRTMHRNGQPVADPDELLVSGPATYRIEDVVRRTDSPSVTYARQIRTAWTFRSQAPDDLEVANCREVFSGATSCAALPVILPRYDLPLDLRNRARAGRPFDFTVHADRALGYAGPAASRMRVSASYDDGATWQRARRLPDQPGDGGFRFRVRHPKLAETNGFVWLRVEAWDRAGNRVEQTIQRAYGLKAR